MVPNGAAYDNYPSFANNGTKTPPGGSTESAKYALGMVPADTFPAEWANYLFHGATAGITRLNNDTGSIKKEINSVLSNFNITPDATLNNQLLEALTKLKAEAALAAHPVGSLYWTSSTENPATTFGGGTWTQIKDKFILAAGDTYSNGATGGSATVTLTTEQLPSHNHTFTGTEHSHSYTPAGSISGGAYKFTGTEHSHSYTPAGTVNISDPGHVHYEQSSQGSSVTNVVSFDASGSYSGLALSNSSRTNRARIDTGKSYTSITATFSGTAASLKATAGGSISITTNPSFTGTAATLKATAGGTIGNTGSGTAHENMPPYIVKFCWQRTA